MTCTSQSFSLSAYLYEARGLLDEYGLSPDDHTGLLFELEQAIGEAIVDTARDLLNDHADDPRIAAALSRARGTTS